MIRGCAAMALAVVVLGVALGGCATKSRIAGHNPPRDLSYESAGRHWEREGVQVGGTLGDASIYTLDGERADLASLWRDKPALIVTASMTCPIARETIPQLAPIAQSHGDRVNVALLYTIDAHPAGEECPYKPGKEWLTKANEEAGVYFPQPKSLEQRIVLAREMDAFVNDGMPMYVDAMDNKAWLALGAGPNLAVLVDTNGKVLAKQGWLDPAAVEPTLLACGVIERAANRTSRTQSQEPTMDLGNFCICLAVKDIAASRAFYEKLGFRQVAGVQEQNWLVMQNGTTKVGLFQGMFDKNMLCFNPGWDSNGKNIDPFTDIREIQKQLKAQGVTFTMEADESSTGPASFMLMDPDGNPILFDQHR